MNAKLRLCARALAALLLAVAFSAVARAQAPGSVLISEFRYQGPGGNNDEYIELYNNTDAAVQIGGWGIYDETGASVKALTRGAVIPARGHYLVVKQGTQYCMAAYGPPDDTYTSALANDRGIGLFRDNVADAAHRIDSVGTTNTPAGLYKEGAGLPALGNTGRTVEYAWVRKMPQSLGGLAQDTDDNASDFMLVSTDAAIINGVVSMLGAPGPEGLLSHDVSRELIGTVLDPNVAVSLAPNRVRDFEDVGTNHSTGTLLVRRTIYNTGTKPIRALKFRVIEMTTMHSPLYTTGSQADLRLLDSTKAVVATSLGEVNVNGVTVDTPTKDFGSGYNATTMLTLAQPLVPCNGNMTTPGCSVSVQFRLGVELGGYFRFYVNVEGETADATNVSRIPRPAK